MLYVDIPTPSCVDIHTCHLLTLQLPQCLCLHLQRTVWLNNGMPMKRYEHVAFPEVLDISRYVYPKTDRVKSLLTPSVGLCDSRPASRRLVGGNHCTAATPSKR